MEAIYDDVSEEVNAVRLALRSLVQHRFATTPFSVSFLLLMCMICIVLARTRLSDWLNFSDC
jgi:hypothetical protein